jgi:hypothetical protein
MKEGSTVIVVIGTNEIESIRAIEMFKDAIDDVWRELRNDQVYKSDVSDLRNAVSFYFADFTSAVKYFNSNKNKGNINKLVFISVENQTFVNPMLSTFFDVISINYKVSGKDWLMSMKTRICQIIVGYKQIVLNVSNCG